MRVSGPDDGARETPALAPGGFAELETPCLLVDVNALEANVRAMADVAASTGVALRPHFKTHKCIEIARRQIALGAVGGTVAKPTEAEVFLAAGVRDLVVASTVVDPRKIARLLRAAADAEATVAGIVESEKGVRAWAAAAGDVGRRAPVLIEVDTGLGRTGVAPGEGAMPLARLVAGEGRLELRGVLTHGGQAYGAAGPAEVAKAGRAEGEALVATAEALRTAGLPCDVVSAGSTPTAPHVAAVAGVTEIRPGNYVFHDGVQVGLGVVPPSRCALTVLATVVARPAAGRVVLDSGSKTLSSDGGSSVRGFGSVLGRPDLVLSRLWEEHGLLPAEAGAGLRVGDRVRIVPNHACAAVNLHEELIVVRGDRVEDRWRVAARGRVL